MEENALLSHELERLKQPVRSAKKESLLYLSYKKNKLLIF